MCEQRYGTVINSTSKRQEKVLDTAIRKVIAGLQKEFPGIKLALEPHGVKFYKCSICHDTGYEVVYGTNKGFPCMCCDTHKKETEKAFYNYSKEELDSL